MPQDRTRYYLNADRTAIVEEGSPEASVMVHGEDLAQYGLTAPAGSQTADTDADADAGDADAKAQASAANKAVSGPSATKAGAAGTTTGSTTKASG
jgi:hypothetical protein